MIRWSDIMGLEPSPLHYLRKFLALFRGDLGTFGGIAEGQDGDRLDTFGEAESLADGCGIKVADPAGGESE